MTSFNLTKTMTPLLAHVLFKFQISVMKKCIVGRLTYLNEWYLSGLCLWSVYRLFLIGLFFLPWLMYMHDCLRVLKPRFGQVKTQFLQNITWVLGQHGFQIWFNRKLNGIEIHTNWMFCKIAHFYYLVLELDGWRKGNKMSAKWFIMEMRDSLWM